MYDVNVYTMSIILLITHSTCASIELCMYVYIVHVLVVICVDFSLAMCQVLAW